MAAMSGQRFLVFGVECGNRFKGTCMGEVLAKVIKFTYINHIGHTLHAGEYEIPSLL